MASDRVAHVLSSLLQSNPTTGSQADQHPLRIACLGAARIAPGALILPSKSCPSVALEAVAARDPTRAAAYAKEHGFARVLTSYEALLADESVDAVYNPLPNGLHHAWAIKTFAKGKHCLLEKPLTSNADQAKEVVEAALSKNVVMLEAFHYRFHPALHEFALLVHRAHSPSNPAVSVHAEFLLPSGFVAADDIRYDWRVAGGAVMDIGVYPISLVLYLSRVLGGAHSSGSFDFTKWSKDIMCVQAEATPYVPSDSRIRDVERLHLDEFGRQRIDERMKATLSVPLGETAKVVTCTVDGGLRYQGKALKARAEVVFKDGTKIEMTNPYMPQRGHAITVTTPAGAKTQYTVPVPSANSGSSEMTSAAVDGHWPNGVGENTWTTYRYQLEAFRLGVLARQRGTHARLVGPPAPGAVKVDRPGGSAPVWMDNAESVVVMEVVDKVYERSGLGKRV